MAARLTHTSRPFLAPSVVEMATGHDPMVSMPERFVEVLLEAIGALR